MAVDKHFTIDSIMLKWYSHIVQRVYGARRRKIACNWGDPDQCARSYELACLACSRLYRVTSEAPSCTCSANLSFPSSSHRPVFLPLHCPTEHNPVSDDDCLRTRVEYCNLWGERRVMLSYNGKLVVPDPRHAIRTILLPVTELSGILQPWDKQLWWPFFFLLLPSHSSTGYCQSSASK